MYLTALLDFKGLTRELTSVASVKMAVASVSFSECVRPSSPRVSYAVAIVIDCEEQATED